MRGGRGREVNKDKRGEERTNRNLDLVFVTPGITIDEPWRGAQVVSPARSAKAGSSRLVKPKAHGTREMSAPRRALAEIHSQRYSARGCLWSCTIMKAWHLQQTAHRIKLVVHQGQFTRVSFGGPTST